jgi:hypothetical protein
MKLGGGMIALLAVGGLAAYLMSKKNSGENTDNPTGATLIDVVYFNGKPIATDATSYPTGRESIYTAPSIGVVLESGGGDSNVGNDVYSEEYIQKTLEYGQELRAEALLNMGYSVSELGQFGISDAAALIAANN